MVDQINQCPVRYHAIKQGQNIAVQDDQQQLTYRQLDNQLTLLAEQLAQQTKLSQSPASAHHSGNNRLVCIASNSIQLLLLQLLCLRTGWLFCPLNPRFTDSEIKQRLTVLNSPYCWVENNAIHSASQTITFNFTFSPESSKPVAPLKIDPLLPCNIIFTSGSSGVPKAIVHHYRNHFFSTLGSHALIPLQSNDHNLLSLPLFHISGYATVIRTIIAGATIELSDQPLSYNLLNDRKVTHLSLVSTQLIRLLKEPLFSINNTDIKHLLLGGSAFPAVLLEALAARGFTYHLSYGCTEMASQVATSNSNNQLTVLPYRQVKIHNNEIYFRGETRFIGYFKRNKLIEIPPQKWLSCGDCGQLKHHQLTISGRKDRQFISGGENIQPEEIEALCLQESYVEKVYIHPIQDSQYGLRIAIFVEFSEVSPACFQAYCEKLKQYLEQHVTPFKRPDHYLTWPDLKRIDSLKITQQHFVDCLQKQGLIA